MTTPFVPTPFATPFVNPNVGGTGAPPIPYISNSEFNFAPTSLAGNQLVPGGTLQQNNQSLADTIRRATSWCDELCFGVDPAGKGASLAASLSVEGSLVRIKGGQIRLICDYRPILEVIGIEVGTGMADLAPLDSGTAGFMTIGRRTIYIPYGYGNFPYRSGDTPAPVFQSGTSTANTVYAVWSYVNGYPHTKLAAAVTQGATSCVVSATDGNGGVWGVYPASTPFPGTALTVVDGAFTEQIFVQAITPNTPSAGLTTLTTSAFANPHLLPLAPDFVPVSAVPDSVHQAVISLTSALIKVRGARAQVMPTIPGGVPNGQALAQAGADEDYHIALRILSEGGFRIRVKRAGMY